MNIDEHGIESCEELVDRTLSSAMEVLTYHGWRYRLRGDELETILATHYTGKRISISSHWYDQHPGVRLIWAARMLPDIDVDDTIDFMLDKTTVNAPLPSDADALRHRYRHLDGRLPSHKAALAAHSEYIARRNALLNGSLDS